MMGNSSKVNASHFQLYEMLTPEKMGLYFAKQYYRYMPQDQYNTFSIIKNQDKHRRQFAQIFAEMKHHNNYSSAFLPIQEASHSRSIACFLGLAICDALGASTEFMPYIKDGYGIILNGFNDIRNAIREQILDARAGKIGIWTDDCCMALCMADSLLLNRYQFMPRHIRYLFVLWIANGLNNGGRPHSIGLGGNIKISIDQFIKAQTDYAIVGDRFNNGNGSLMRLAPIPIAFKDNEAKAIEISGKSSLTTHNGEQAEECCKLLALIIVRLINRKSDEDWKEVLNKACNQFETKCLSVYFLSRSMQEPKEYYDQLCRSYGKKFKAFNQTLSDRNWNWKEQNYTYSKTRADDKPGYVGSYCMDALTMALHTVWFSKSFKEVALINANMGGDCDSVGAIAGQIAGAIYGIDDSLFDLYIQMEDFKQGKYEVFLKAYKLANHEKL